MWIVQASGGTLQLDFKPWDLCEANFWTRTHLEGYTVNRRNGLQAIEAAKHGKSIAIFGRSRLPQRGD